jgi:hypothetical protein
LGVSSPGEPTMTEEDKRLFKIEVTATLTDKFDQEAESKADAEDYGEWTVRDDLQDGITAEFFDIEAEAVPVNNLDE